MRKTIRATLTYVAISIAIAGCQSRTPHDEIATPTVGPLPTSAPSTLAARGEIVSRQPINPPLADPDQVIGAAWRATYRTISGVDGGPREASGVFVVPRGTPPPGGWPVIAAAHGTTGIAADCAPSADPALLGYLHTVQDLAGNGYAVALTDYEGLGTPGSHPYLEPRTAAFNVTDAVRALQHIVPDISNRWIAFGNSQGGQASWAADEFARSYAEPLKLAGAVALSPAANLTPLAQRSADGTLTDDQQSALATVIAGIERYDTGLRGRNLIDDTVRAHENQVFACHPAARSDAVPYPAVRLANPEAVAAVREALRRIALPQQPLDAPLLIINGSSDQTIPSPWVAAAAQAACRLGGPIYHVEVSGAGHGDLGAKSYQLMYRWIADRFAAAPAPTNCGQPPEQIGYH